MPVSWPLESQRFYQRNGDRCGSTSTTPRGKNALAGKNELDHFGTQVALSDGGTVLAILASPSHVYDSGYAQVYRYNESQNDWYLFDNIDASKTEADLTMALSGDGRRLAVGIPSYTDPGITQVWECDPFTDSERNCAIIGQELSGSDYEDVSATDLALSRDGSFLAIGAPGMLDCAYRTCANVRVYQFARGSEDVWGQVGQEIGGGIGFGSFLQISSDGSMLGVFTVEVGDNDQFPVSGPQSQV